MTELTKEQLIEEAKLKIAIAKCHPNSEMARVEGELFKIALASLVAEPLVPVMYKGMKLLTKEGLELIRDGIAEATGLEAMCMAKALLSAPSVPVVPDNVSGSLAYAYKELTPEIMRGHIAVFERYGIAPNDSSTTIQALRIALDGIERSAAMLQSQGEGNPHVTPARLPGGFTIEDAKVLHEDLVRSHISQALSGEKMKKKDRDADLRWIHGVIVQAAWFVKASLEQNALSGTPPVTPAGWISCSDAVPAEYCDVILLDDLGNVFPGSWDKVFCPTCGGNKMAFVDKDGVEVESSTHWMPLPEPPQEVNG